jgi:hypothetical protein
MLNAAPRTTLGHFATRAGALSAMLLLLTPGSLAQRGSAGPFDNFVGSWSGSGTVSLMNGANERIRCQAAHALGNNPNNLRSTLRCASASYSFELNSDVNYRGGAISGAWREASRNMAGFLSGSARPGELAARIDSPGFSASLTLATRGDRQSVTLQSQGTELTGVTIALTRR